MQSPPAEWTLAIGHLAILDYLRSIGDADHDTASECVRNFYSRLPHGRALWAVTTVVGAAVLWRHIDKPMR